MVRGTTENGGGSGKQQLNCKVARSLERNKERTALWSEKVSHFDSRRFFYFSQKIKNRLKNLVQQFMTWRIIENNA